MATLGGEVVVLPGLAFLLNLRTLEEQFIPLSALWTFRPSTLASYRVVGWLLRSTLTSIFLFDVCVIDLTHTETNSLFKTILFPGLTSQGNSRTVL